ncbi:MAG: hypothetical protein L0Y80_11700 [Ignavibacteriae bacterium]|nr:hypothetical protein [Ignavibacteriota bacterium]
MRNKLALILFVAMLGCTDSGVKPTDEMILAVPEEFVVVPNQPIDTEIRYLFLSLTEQEQPGLVLQFLTTRYYVGSQWQIISSLERNDYRFAVSLERIQEPTEPEPGVGFVYPARTSFDLGHLPDGAYSFDIHINGKTVRMAMLVRDGWVTESRIQPNNYISERVWMPD